jgi:CheY-like chemotaxis protein
VLVVDDNKVIRQLIRVNLELEGLEVVTAADGAECLDVVHQVRPDVVTLDVVMPRLDGIRTAARLRADPRTRDMPLAIVSACGHHEVEAGLEAGVDAFLAKPFEPAELVRMVRQLVERARSEGRQRGGPRAKDHPTNRPSNQAAKHPTNQVAKPPTNHPTEHATERAREADEQAKEVDLPAVP